MDIIAKKIAALIALFPGYVIDWQVNVKVDVKVDGKNTNVTQVGT